MQTELSGPHQATDPHAMPLADYIAEMMHSLDDPHRSSDEILVQHVEALRWAGRNDDYQRVFVANNNR